MPKLTAEKIARITRRPQGKFQKDTSVKEIMELVSRETSGPVDKLALRENKALSASSGQVIGTENFRGF